MLVAKLRTGCNVYMKHGVAYSHFEQGTATTTYASITFKCEFLIAGLNPPLVAF